MMHTKYLWSLCSVVVVLALAGCGYVTSVGQHFENGNAYVQAGEYDKAAAEFEAVLAKEPDNVSALSNLGVVYYDLQKHDQAIAQYQKALELAPEDADIHSNLAAAFVQKGQLQAGLAEYQKAVGLDPELAEAHFGLGVTLRGLGRTDEAIKAFERFQELDTGKDPKASEYAKLYLQELRGQ
jgi:tetratricopeptide (TPR) repeat protein